MAEEKKRFPWRLWAGTLVALLLAAVVGFIETVGRRGTVVGRYERIHVGMSRGRVDQILSHDFPTENSGWLEFWNDGPLSLCLTFRDDRVIDKSLESSFTQTTNSRAWWHVRRWAEQAYTAIHGPRR